MYIYIYIHIRDNSTPKVTRVRGTPYMESLLGG